MSSEQNTNVEIPLSSRRLTRRNPPNLAALSYRACRYTDTLERMLQRLPLTTLPQAGDSVSAPLSRLNTRAPDDWTAGLLHGWAAVTDVLSFYQERIANEGFLGTATERRSVLELLRGLGYEFRPGVAAGTYLMFTVIEDEENPDLVVSVPVGTAVQSVPVGDEPSQTFETSEPFEARAAWNRLFLDVSGGGPEPSNSGLVTEQAATAFDLFATSMRIDGAGDGLSAGSRILLTSTGDLGRFVELTDVQTNSEAGWTAISWESPPSDEPPARVDGRTGDTGGTGGLIGFAQQATLFPYTPTGLDFRGGDARGWSPAGIGLPPIPITALTRTNDGILVAGTEQDVYRSINGGRTWQPFATGAVQKKIYALGVGHAGDVYAGSEEGDIYRSADGKEAWRMMSGGPPEPPPGVLGKAKQLVPVPGKSRNRLPQAPVRSLSEYQDGKDVVLVAGTDEGVFRSSDRGRTWQSANRFLPQPAKDGKSKTSVADAAVKDAESKRQKPILATAAGVFPIGRKIGKKRILLAAAALFLVLQYFNIDVPAEITKLLPPSVSQFFEAPPTESPPEDAEAGKDDGDEQREPSQAKAPGDQATVSPDDPTAPQETQEPTPDDVENLFAGALDGLFDTIAGWIGLPTLAEYLKNFTAPLANFASVLTAIYAAVFGYGRTLQVVQKTRGRSLGQPVAAVVVTSEGRLIAGTEEGIFRSIEPGGDDEAAVWRKLGGWLLKQVAGDAARRWELVQQGVKVTSLVVTSDDAIVAGTADGAVWRSEDHGGTWRLWDERLKLKTVASLVVSDEGIFAAGEAAEGDMETRWSPWQLQHGHVVLATPVEEVKPGSWMLLHSDDRPGELLAREIQRTVVVESGDVEQPGNVTALQVSEIGSLADWDRSRTTVWFGGRPLTARRPVPVSGGSVAMFGLVPSLQDGQKLVVQGKRARVRIRRDLTQPVMMVADDGAAVALAAGQSLTVIGLENQAVGGPSNESAAPVSARQSQPPGANGAGDGAGGEGDSPDDVQPETALANGSPGGEHRQRNRRSIRVRNEIGVEGWLEAGFDFEPAREKDPSIGELVSVEAVRHTVNQTQLQLTRPLTNVFDGDTVTVHANVVHATHGETVEDEVLGSSNGSQRYQQFWLQETDGERRLTFVNAATASGVEPELSVTVSGVAWHRVPALLDAKSDDRVFTLRQDELGRSTIAFGDGDNGARLPANHEQIAARYRIGIGRQGNVPAKSLTLLTAGPAGIDEVINPLSATGGTDPESIEQAKPRAALHVRNFGRIVSLTDYENFARTFGGIGQASSKLFQIRGRSLLHLTVADAAGRPVPAASDVRAALAKAVDRFRTVKHPVVMIDSYRPRFLRIAALLMIESVSADPPAQTAVSPARESQHPDAASDREAKIMAVAQHELANQFGFDRAQFGRSVSVSRAISILQAIEGVHAVQVTEFYLQGDSPARQESLRVPLARWDEGGVLPAEMIVFDAADVGSLRLQFEFV